MELWRGSKGIWETEEKKKEENLNSFNRTLREPSVTSKTLIVSNEVDGLENSEAHHSTENWKLYSTVATKRSEFQKSNGKNRKKESSSNFWVSEGTVATKILTFSHEGDSWETIQGHRSMQNLMLYHTGLKKWREFLKTNRKLWRKGKFVEFHGRRNSRDENSHIFPWRRHLRDNQRTPFDAEFNALSHKTKKMKGIFGRNGKHGRKGKFVEFHPRKRNSRDENSHIFPWRRRLRDMPRTPFLAECNSLSRSVKEITRTWRKEKKKWEKNESSSNFRLVERKSRQKFSHFPMKATLERQAMGTIRCRIERSVTECWKIKRIWENEQNQWGKWKVHRILN